MATLAFETSDLQELSEELSLPIQQSETFTRAGGSSEITTNSNVIAAAFSEELLVDGNNSEVIELGDSRALVLNVREHTEATLRPLDEVRGEIAAILRTELERERAQAVGEEILAALRAGNSADALIAANELQWIEQRNAARDQTGLNGEVLQSAFSMSAPADNAPAYEGFALNNGTYVVLELLGVNRGSLEQMDDAARQTLANGFIEREGRAAFDAFLANTRNNADITENLSASAFNDQPLL